MANVKKVNPQDLTLDEAGVLLNVAASTVGDLVRSEKLSRPISVEALKAYSETRKSGRKGGGAKTYHVKMTPAQATELLNKGYEVIDPGVKEREAAEKRREAAKSRLGNLSL